MKRKQSKGFGDSKNPIDKALSKNNKKFKLFSDEVLEPLSKKFEETYPETYNYKFKNGKEARHLQFLFFNTPEFFEPLWRSCEPPEDKDDPDFGENIREIVGFKHESERYGLIYCPDTRYAKRCPQILIELLSVPSKGGSIFTYYGFNRIIEPQEGIGEELSREWVADQ